jgi:hypothetical protein
MGDYVNGKNNSENDNDQMTLFEPKSNYGKALKTDFNLLSNSKYSDLINEILENYLNK